MYELKDFVPLIPNDLPLDSNHDVLIWSRKTGYMFTQFSKIDNIEYRIVAIRKPR